MQISGLVHVSPQLSSFLPSALERLTSRVVDFLGVVVNQARHAFPQEGVAPAVEARVRTVWLPVPDHRGLPGCPGAWGRGPGVGVGSRGSAPPQVPCSAAGGGTPQRGC